LDDRKVILKIIIENAIEAGIEMSFDNINHNGSGIALGHPVGATVLRIIVRLVRPRNIGIDISLTNY
jgi:hypothetical protein